MRDLLALHPSFLRIPGGNYLEGQAIATRFPWKSTLGPLASRPGHPWHGDRRGGLDDRTRTQLGQVM